MKNRWNISKNSFRVPSSSKTTMYLLSILLVYRPSVTVSACTKDTDRSRATWLWRPSFFYVFGEALIYLIDFFSWEICFVFFFPLLLLLVVEMFSWFYFRSFIAFLFFYSALLLATVGLFVLTRVNAVCDTVAVRKRQVNGDANYCTYRATTFDFLLLTFFFHPSLLPCFFLCVVVCLSVSVCVCLLVEKVGAFLRTTAMGRNSQTERDQEGSRAPLKMVKVKGKRGGGGLKPTTTTTSERHTVVHRRPHLSRSASRACGITTAAYYAPQNAITRRGWLPRFRTLSISFLYFFFLFWCVSVCFYLTSSLYFFFYFIFIFTSL